MEIQCCTTCKYDHYEKEECICMKDNDYIPHDIDPKNKCNNYVSRNKEAYIRKIVSELRQELLSDKELYNALVTCISSALKEIPTGTGLYDVAEVVANRIIGVVDIYEIDLTLRSYCCLKRAGIDTVEKLKRLSHDNLCNIKNLNQKCIKEIEEKIKNF